VAQLTVIPAVTQQTATPGVSHQTARPLAAGIVAGPLFLALWALQAFARDGFDPGRHPIKGALRWHTRTSWVGVGAWQLHTRPGGPLQINSAQGDSPCTNLSDQYS
jgi:hypothetical protein